MLDLLEVRLLSAIAAAGVLIGFFLIRNQGAFGRAQEREVRASSPVRRSLEVAWLVAVNLPLLSVFAGALWPDLLYFAPFHISFAGDSAAQLAGFALFALGGFVTIQAIRYLGKYMVLHIEVRRDHELVTSGPYSRVRHPAYTGVMLTALGSGLLFMNLALLADFLVVAAIAAYRAGVEESLLSSPQGFGLQYRAYIARTGRFLPRLR